MTSATSSHPAAHVSTGTEADAALPVLGMLAYGEVAAFTRLAADSAMAPSLTARLALARQAGLAVARLERVAVRVRELGGELEPVMAPFAGVLVEFDRRTPPSTWWERLLKGYVGYGVSDDFSRIVAQALDPVTRELVEDVLADQGEAAMVVESLAAAGAIDATLASRLALWGRRLVGESLGVVQNVLAHHPEIEALLERACPGADPQQKLFASLTAEHSRRMERLGLTP
ncbi:MAG: hypothetical protein HGA44_18800 [Cellulomonadaceae bacterium]|nr:hypothetical protein [Cellulomonadaceae bacterium]